jgi:hypothetical protein
MSVDIEARLPKDYKRAIVSVELACRIVYNKAQGLETEIAEALKIEK